jgi:hypothetical protein
MSKHEMFNEPPSSSAEAATPPAPGSEPEASATPKMALAGSDTGKIETPKTEAVSASKLEPVGAETVKSTAVRKIELARIEGPGIAPDIDDLKHSSRENTADSDDAPAQSSEKTRHASRFTLLAAALALAAALGAMVGALAAYGLARPSATAAAGGKIGLEEIQALKENIVQARVELAALKLSIDSGTRNAATQFTKISERIDRVERGQTEPAAKLTKVLDALERLSRGETASLKDATGSIASPPGGTSQAGRAGAVEGWVVRDVQRGTALIEGRMGLIEVDQGDVVPGLGRVAAIRKQDGRWVVVTSRGLIMPPR